MSKKIFFSVFLCFFSLHISLAQNTDTSEPDARMMRFPDVSENHIAFVYAGDIWVVEKNGGTAIRLSSPKGSEMFPKFSPDGTNIAFSGNYDGNTDVYTVPVGGGIPKRLTHHPNGDYVVEWYPDGNNVLYRSRMYSPSFRFNRFFRQSVDGGMPAELPMPYGEMASFNAEGNKIAFQYISREFRTWKRYRGGMASDLWIYDLEKDTSWNFTDFAGTDAVPMWHKNTIYFLSDRDTSQTLNIWSYDLESKEFNQVTSFTEYDVKWPSLGPKDIVFQNAGKLYLLDIESGRSKVVPVRIPADLPHIRTQYKDVSKQIFHYSISPTGQRAIFGARGEILTLPKEHGSLRKLTNSSSIAERSPAWSPDGKKVAYFSDRTGEYELYTRNADGSGDEQQITKNSKAFRYHPLWSPDNEKIAFHDKTGALYVVEVEDGTPRLIDKDPWFNISNYNWSPDSRWIAYSRRNENGNQLIFVYSLENEQSHQLTSHFYEDFLPVFDTKGDHLFFYSNRTFKPVYSDMDATWIYPNSTNLYVATLRKDVKSLLAPRNDEEGEDEDKKKAKGKDKKKDEDEEEKVEDVEIDIEDFEKRVEKITEIGNVGSLYAIKDKVLFIEFPPGGAGEPGKPSGTLKYYDIKKREQETIISGINNAIVSHNGKKILYKSNSTYGIIDVEKDKKVGDDKIDISKLKAWINPREEWEQIFTEAWRIERDFFYDPDMHGLEWKAIYEQYKKLLPYVADREDLNYVIGEMIAELNASHAYVGGGDMEKADNIPVGLLGCDFIPDKENQAYKISNIYEGAPWDIEPKSPLRQPGLEISEGDYLLAVNGRPLNISEDPWAAFQGLADEVVSLTINSKPDMEDAREILVKPEKSEYRLRNLSWIESNRKKIDSLTDGKVGYIYVPNTGRSGQSELLRQFIPQHNKEALIIDERFNSGGQIPDRFIELLNRPVYNYWARRDQKDWQTPFLSHTGPKVMLINSWAGSGGDAFPYYFKKAGLGPLVGTRTWGGLIGISGNPRLIDGGMVTAPTFGFWNVKGEWEVEGYGVDPDYEIVNKPHEMAKGNDSQLEKAIEIVLKKLEEQPSEKMKKPPYPDRSGK